MLDRKLEYNGGYLYSSTTELEVLLSEYRARAKAKTEAGKGGAVKGLKDILRVWAAGQELGKKIELSNPKQAERLTLNYILNNSGKGRLSTRRIEKAQSALTSLHGEGLNGYRVKVSRELLRCIAKGNLSVPETLVSLVYTLRRKPQRKTLKSLSPGQRYARFTFRELQAITGLHPSTASTACRKLKERGLLEVVEIVQPNVNRYGLCFVDGPALSLNAKMGKPIGEVFKVSGDKNGKAYRGGVSDTPNPSCKNGKAPVQKRETPMSKMGRANKLISKLQSKNHNREKDGFCSREKPERKPETPRQSSNVIEHPAGHIESPETLRNPDELFRLYRYYVQLGSFSDSENNLLNVFTAAERALEVAEREGAAPDSAQKIFVTICTNAYWAFLNLEQESRALQKLKAFREGETSTDQQLSELIQAAAAG